MYVYVSTYSRMLVLVKWRVVIWRWKVPMLMDGRRSQPVGQGEEGHRCKGWDSRARDQVEVFTS